MVEENKEESDLSHCEDNLYSERKRVKHKSEDPNEAEVLRVRATLGAQLKDYEVLDNGLIYLELDGVRPVNSRIVYDGVKMFISTTERRIYTRAFPVFSKESSTMVRVLAQYVPDFDKSKYENLKMRYGRG